MTRRIDVEHPRLAALRAVYAVEQYVRSSGLEPALVAREAPGVLPERLRYCVDMHTKDARLEGETEQRLYAVPVGARRRSSPRGSARRWRSRRR